VTKGACMCNGQVVAHEVPSAPVLGCRISFRGLASPGFVGPCAPKSAHHRGSEPAKACPPTPFIWMSRRVTTSVATTARCADPYSLFLACRTLRISWHPVSRPNPRLQDQGRRNSAVGAHATPPDSRPYPARSVSVVAEMRDDRWLAG
jgi:hypothetical protein